MKIQVSIAAKKILQDNTEFTLEYRGEVDLKVRRLKYTPQFPTCVISTSNGFMLSRIVKQGRGTMKTFWLHQRLDSVSEAPDQEVVVIVS